MSGWTYNASEDRRIGDRGNVGLDICHPYPNKKIPVFKMDEHRDWLILLKYADYA